MLWMAVVVGEHVTETGYQLHNQVIEDAYQFVCYQCVCAFWWISDLCHGKLRDLRPGMANISHYPFRCGIKFADFSSARCRSHKPTGAPEPFAHAR